MVQSDRYRNRSRTPPLSTKGCMRHRSDDPFYNGPWDFQSYEFPAFLKAVQDKWANQLWTCIVHSSKVPYGQKWCTNACSSTFNCFLDTDQDRDERDRKGEESNSLFAALSLSLTQLNRAEKLAKTKGKRHKGIRKSKDVWKWLPINQIYRLPFWPPSLCSPVSLSTSVKLILHVVVSCLRYACCHFLGVTLCSTPCNFNKDNVSLIYDKLLVYSVYRFYRIRHQLMMSTLG